MKNILIVLAIIISNAATAGNEKAYNKAMTSNIKQLFEAKSPEQFDVVANKFTRIGDAEKDKWLPYYYASLANVQKSLRLKEAADKDNSVTQALILLKKASDLEENNSEIIALEGFLYMIQISIDPANRGQSHTPKTFAAFGKALGISPNNPRALLFQGQMYYGTAQFFGSSTEEACAMVVKSVALFDKEKAGETTILPSWGFESAQDYIKRCQPKAEKDGE